MNQVRYSDGLRETSVLPRFAALRLGRRRTESAPDVRTTDSMDAIPRAATIRFRAEQQTRSESGPMRYESRFGDVSGVLNKEEE